MKRRGTRSWRNSPSRAFSQAIIDWLTVPGTAVGEAIRQAKLETRNRTLVETYNLLGDPAVQLALSEGRVDLEITEDSDSTRIAGRLDLGDFDGEGVVEWMDAGLGVVYSVPVNVVDSGFSVIVDSDAVSAAGEAVGVRARVVGDGGVREAVGWRQLVAEVDPDAGSAGVHGSAPEKVDQGSEEQSKEQETK